MQCKVSCWLFCSTVQQIWVPDNAEYVAFPRSAFGSSFRDYSDACVVPVWQVQLRQWDDIRIDDAYTVYSYVFFDVMTSNALQFISKLNHAFLMAIKRFKVTVQTLRLYGIAHDLTWDVCVWIILWCRFVVVYLTSFVVSCTSVSSVSFAIH